MATDTDSVTIALPRILVEEFPALSDDLTARMHELLERNTDGALTPTERTELETLVRMAEVAQILAMAAHAAQPQ